VFILCGAGRCQRTGYCACSAAGLAVSCEAATPLALGAMGLFFTPYPVLQWKAAEPRPTRNPSGCRDVSLPLKVWPVGVTSVQPDALCVSVAIRHVWLGSAALTVGLGLLLHRACVVGAGGKCAGPVGTARTASARSPSRGVSTGLWECLSAWVRPAPAAWPASAFRALKRRSADIHSHGVACGVERKGFRLNYDCLRPVFGG